MKIPMDLLKKQRDIHLSIGSNIFAPLRGPSRKDLSVFADPEMIV